MTDTNSLKALPYSNGNRHSFSDKYITLADRMKEEESGDRSSPIWLLVNPKYPAVRDDIWAPILDEIQDKVYRKLHARIDTGNIFISNAVSDVGVVSNTSTSNSRAQEVAEEIVRLRKSVREYQPKIIFTFGTITYEFVKHVLEIRPDGGPKYWSTANIGDEFEKSIANFDVNHTNKIPLPHRVMKSGKFTDDNNLYSSYEDRGNFFRDVGSKIAERIIENKDSLKIWIE